MLCNANISTSLLSYSMSSYTILLSIPWLLRSSFPRFLVSTPSHLFCITIQSFSALSYPLWLHLASHLISSHLHTYPYLVSPHLTFLPLYLHCTALHCTAPSLIPPLPSSPLLSPPCTGQDAHPGQRSFDR